MITKLLPLQGALLIAIIPRAMPWARSFCPFRACMPMNEACMLMNEACMPMNEACMLMNEACMPMNEACMLMNEACIPMNEAFFQGTKKVVES